LIVRLGAIGDVVNAIVVATALREAWPESRIAWAVHELALPLVDRHPAIDRVHLWRKRGGWTGLREVLSEIRGERYELALDLQRLAKSAALARLSGASRVVGFDRARTKEASWLLPRERLTPAASAHVVDQYLEVLAHLGLPPRAPRFELPRDDSAVTSAERLLAVFPRAPILIHVGATKPANRWPPRRFGELASALIDRGLPVAFTGSAADRAAVEQASAVEPRAVDLCGRTGLLDLAELQRRARLVVSCDSGPMHLAAAVGTRVVALFGAADERRTGPYGTRHVVVRTRPECAPCRLRVCNRPRHECMEDLEVETVVAAVLHAVERA
jgi:lipopolysaccharide heptosyltransferase II